uniref:Uncharacterized protein n=1 Tax=Electrophorus electricus TaxID=8005 RepID=A0AAY5F3A6_ELEEL
MDQTPDLISNRKIRESAVKMVATVHQSNSLGRQSGCICIGRQSGGSCLGRQQGGICIGRQSGGSCIGRQKGGTSYSRVYFISCQGHHFYRLDRKVPSATEMFVLHKWA